MEQLKFPLNASKNYNQKSIQSVIYDIEDFQSYAETNFKKNKNLTDMTDQQKDVVSKLCESVICAKNKNQWKKNIIELHKKC